MQTTKDKITIADTQADHIHGRTRIQPGDKVKHQSRWKVVVSVNPEENRLLITKPAGKARVERIYAEGVNDYKER